MSESPAPVRAKTQRRHDRVLELVNQHITEVEDLAVELGVSSSTVRRDLMSLEQQGVINRTYGGAIPAAPPLSEHSFTTSLGAAVEEKNAIARLAASLIRPGESIFLDAGTTCLALAEQLLGQGKRQVITRGLEAALVLRKDPDIHIEVTGGQVHPQSHGLVGAMALHTLARVYVDIAVLGADVVCPTRGLGEPTLEEIELKEQSVRSSGRQLLLVDHRKFEPQSAPAWMPLYEPCTVITDHRVTANQLEPWRNSVEVLQTSPPNRST